MVIFVADGLVAAYPITVIEALWALVDPRRHQDEMLPVAAKC